jgi:hypothetical protein
MPKLTPKCEGILISTSAKQLMTNGYPAICFFLEMIAVSHPNILDFK